MENMENRPTQHSLTWTVTDDMCAKRIGTAGAKILSTPNMLSLMEACALELAKEYLEEGETTVGAEAHIRHLAPTPVGMKITATAEVTGVSANGKMITFKVSASDEEGLIGEGTHTRAVIDNARFLQKCNDKLAKVK